MLLTIKKQDYSNYLKGGMVVMAICTTCGIEVPDDDLYYIGGRVVCEKCSLAQLDPSKPCSGGIGTYNKD